MKRIIRNQKGMALVELLIVTAIIAFTMPLLFYIFIDGIRSFDTYSKYINQHDKVMEVTLRIRKDIEEAEGYKLYSSLEPTPVCILALRYPVYGEEEKQPVKFKFKYWKFEDGKLSVMTNEGTAINEAGDYKDIIAGIDTSKVAIEPEGESERDIMMSGFNEIRGRIILSIKPESENRVHKNRNITKPVITEYSVDYKNNNIGEFGSP